MESDGESPLQSDWIREEIIKISPDLEKAKGRHMTDPVYYDEYSNPNINTCVTMITI
jgi:hypothetical protein